jgi:hypothetical protein
LSRSLTVSSFFTPSDQATDYADDADFGSGGAAVVLNLASGTLKHLVIGGGKDGTQKIESLRKQYPYAPLDNLKFATWRFELTPVWVDNVLMRKWLVSGMAYFKPVSCEPAGSRMPASSQGYLEATMSANNRIVGQMPRSFTCSSNIAKTPTKNSHHLPREYPITSPLWYQLWQKTLEKPSQPLTTPNSIFAASEVPRLLSM